MKLALFKRRVLNAGALWISYVKLLPWLFRLNKNSIVIDGGANTGYISSYLSITGATIYAFEPDPIAFAVLVERCGLKKNIECINKGVWDKSATVKLYRHRAMAGERAFTVSSSLIRKKSNVNDSAAIDIQVIDLIQFIQSLNKKIDLVKLDIEGAEIEILKKILATNSHTLFKIMHVESHETKIPGQEEELERIKKELKRKEITNIKLNWI